MDARKLNNADIQKFRNYTEEEIEAFGDVPIPALPLKFIRLVDQIKDSLKDQLNEYEYEMEKLERAEDYGQTILDLVVYDDNKDCKKKGPEPKNKTVGPISASFELPHVCFEYNVDIEAVIANAHPGRPKKYSILDRVKDWKLQYRRRPKGTRKDHKYYHLPSNLKFRSEKEMINYILYEVLPSETEKSQKRKQDNNDNSKCIKKFDMFTKEKVMYMEVNMS